MMEKTIQNCGKCGLCLNACPVYTILKEEQASPRGKLALIKAYDRNQVDASALLKELLTKCLMCGACSSACPSGIDHYGKFREIRKKMVAELGDAPAVKSLIYLLAKDYRLRWSIGLAKRCRQLIPDIFAKTYKLGNIPLKQFPEFNSAPFRESVDRIILPDKRQIGTVIYFTGCATNYLYADTGFAVIGILTHMGFKVIIPEKQTCCSIPLLFHGETEKAAHNITANVKALSAHEADAILVDCSTCGQALHEEYPAFFKQQDTDASDATRIAGKVVDILSFIEQHLDLLELDPAPREKVPVTYHAPCHSRYGFQSGFSVDALLRKLPFIDYRKTCDTDQCCGGGGTFFYEFPDISKQMVKKKISNAKSVRPEFWLTDCPVCRINLSGNLEEEDKIEVIHPVSLIYERIQL